MAATPTLNRIRSESGIQDVLNILNRDGVEELFDDFEGDLLKDEWLETTGTGAASVAGGLALLATTASDDKGTGLIGHVGWMAGKGCMVQSRFAIDTLNSKVEFGFVNAQGSAETGVINNPDTGSIQTATSVVGLYYDLHSVAATVSSWNAIGAAATAVRRSLYGAQAANAANDATATTYTAASTYFGVIGSLIGQTITVPDAATRYSSQMMVASNTTSVATGTWITPMPNDDQGYRWGNVPLALGVPVAAEYHTYTVKLEATLEAFFYIDGVLAARIPAAVAAATTSLAPYIHVVDRAGAGATLSVDYLWALQSRRA